MYNHFRTLLLNLPYAQDVTEHIPSSFSVSVKLPTALSDVYSLLFPTSSTRARKIFLADNYMKLVDATPYNDIVTLLDPRITYGGYDSDYFQFRRISLPTSSSTSFSIQVMGSSDLKVTTDLKSEVFQVTQISNTSAVSVTSALNGKVYLASAALTFTSGTSNLVTIPDTGISFVVLGTNFTSSTRKIFTFRVDVPFEFDFESQYSLLKSRTVTVDTMFRTSKDKVDLIFENLWRQHPNSVYQFVGLLSAFVERVNVI